MKKITKPIESFNEYISFIEKIGRLNNGIVLFRGQSESKPLLPSIARDSKADTTKLEMEMLSDLERRSGLLIEKEIRTKWEWLVMAQHFGLKTRLLDWSSNPLVALWFACCNEYKLKEDSFVYIFEANDSLVVDTTKNDDPFKIKRTRILKPYLNNQRIIAQNGWFTAHAYSEKNQNFVKLEINSEVKDLITQLKIPASVKPEILKELSLFGINNWTMFPDFSGLCNHLNWKYTSNNSYS